MTAGCYVDFRYKGSTYKTWYRVFGDLTTQKTPLVLLHGGPGIPHPYMLPFSDLSSEYSIPVVIYDQIGSGNSSLIPDSPLDFWTLDVFMDELDNLLANLGISDNFFLLGHSWGSMLGSWYAAMRQPSGMKALILADGLAQMRDWTNASIELLKELPESISSAINAFELDEKIYTPEWKDVKKSFEKDGVVTEGFEETLERYKAYGGSMPKFVATFVCTVQPFPAELGQSMVLKSKDPSVGFKMFGPTSVRCTGLLKDWTVVEHLSKIKVPTLIYNGGREQAQDFVVQPFFDHIPKAKWVKFIKSSHMPHFEEREKCMKGVAEFLQSI